MTDEIDPRAPRDFTVAIRKGKTIDTFLTYKIDPPITAEEDGRYLALLNEEKGTATLQRVGGWPEAPKPDPYEDEDENRWAAFTNDELDHIQAALEDWCEPQPTDINPSYNPRDYDSARALLTTAQAELERRTAMTIISEIHRTSSEDVGFLDGSTADGECVYVRYKYGLLQITTGQTIDDAHDSDSVIFQRQLADGGYHITDSELVEATSGSDIRWPSGFGKTGNPLPQQD